MHLMDKPKVPPVVEIENVSQPISERPNDEEATATP